MMLKSHIVSETHINTSTIKLKKEFLNKEFCMLIFIALYGLSNFHGLIIILLLCHVFFFSFFKSKCYIYTHINRNDKYVIKKLEQCKMYKVKINHFSYSTLSTNLISVDVNTVSVNSPHLFHYICKHTSFSTPFFITFASIHPGLTFFVLTQCNCAILVHLEGLNQA